MSDAKEWPPRIRFAEGPAAMRLLFTMVRDGLATVDEAMSCIKVDDDPPPAPAPAPEPEWPATHIWLCECGQSNGPMFLRCGECDRVRQANQPSPPAPATEEQKSGRHAAGNDGEVGAPSGGGVCRIASAPPYEWRISRTADLSNEGWEECEPPDGRIEEFRDHRFWRRVRAADQPSVQHGCNHDRTRLAADSTQRIETCLDCGRVQRWEVP